MAGWTENLQHKGTGEEERLREYQENSETTMHHGHVRQTANASDASGAGVQQRQTDDIRECSEIARDATRQGCATRQDCNCSNPTLILHIIQFE